MSKCISYVLQDTVMYGSKSLAINIYSICEGPINGSTVRLVFSRAGAPVCGLSLHGTRSLILN